MVTWMIHRLCVLGVGGTSVTFGLWSLANLVTLGIALDYTLRLEKLVIHVIGWKMDSV